MRLHICESTQSSSIHNVCPSLRGAPAKVLARENFSYSFKEEHPGLLSSARSLFCFTSIWRARLRSAVLLTNQVRRKHYFQCACHSNDWHGTTLREYLQDPKHTLKGTAHFYLYFWNESLSYKCRFLKNHKSYFEPSYWIRKSTHKSGKEVL